MRTTKLLLATVSSLVLLAACGGSASKDAAGTLMETKQPAVEAAAPGTGVNVATDGAATDQNGKVATVEPANPPGCIYPMVQTGTQKAPENIKVCK